jgi:hypothetical protein
MKDAQDVGMVQRGRCLGFQLKAAETNGIRRVRRRKNLDGNIPFQGGVTGKVHLSHAARSEEFTDLVLPELRSGSLGHD